MLFFKKKGDQDYLGWLDEIRKSNDLIFLKLEVDVQVRKCQ